MNGTGGQKPCRGHAHASIGSATSETSAECVTQEHARHESVCVSVAGVRVWVSIRGTRVCACRPVCHGRVRRCAWRARIGCGTRRGAGVALTAEDGPQPKVGRDGRHRSDGESSACADGTARATRKGQHAQRRSDQHLECCGAHDDMRTDQAAVVATVGAAVGAAVGATGGAQGGAGRGDL